MLECAIEGQRTLCLQQLGAGTCGRQGPPAPNEITQNSWSWNPPGETYSTTYRKGPRLKWAKGRFGSKNEEKVKVLRMEFSIVENLSGLQESIFNLSRGRQIHFGEKSTNWSNFIKFIDFPPFPLFGVPWAAVIRPQLGRRNQESALAKARPWLNQHCPGYPDILI